MRFADTNKFLINCELNGAVAGAHLTNTMFRSKSWARNQRYLHLYYAVLTAREALG